VAPITCQTTFNVPVPCSYFPLDDTNCAQPSMVGSFPFSGTLTMNGDERIFPVDAGLSSRLTAVGSYSGSGNVAERWRNSLTATISTSGNAILGAVPTIRTDVSYGNPWTCANPVDFVVRDTFGGPINFSGTLTHESLRGYNTYGTTNATAPNLNSADGGLCEQVCGNVTKTCGDDRAWYRLTIPPRRSVALEYRLWTVSGGGANVHVQAGRPSGGFICNLTDNVIIGTTPSTYRARLANNTDVPQDVVVGPYLFGSGAGHWTMAVGLE
jgi:hypothetical protein